jgi:hypothetical protein
MYFLPTSKILASLIPLAQKSQVAGRLLLIIIQYQLWEMDVLGSRLTSKIWKTAFPQKILTQQ